MENITLADIKEMTTEQEEKLATLLSSDEINNGVSQEESKERTALQFLRGANAYVNRYNLTIGWIEDDIEDTDEEKEVLEKMKANYEVQAIKLYEAYLENTK